MPAVIILDIALGEENGLEFIGYLKKNYALRRVKMPALLMCSMYEDPFRIKTAMQLGATGYNLRGNNKIQLPNIG